MSKPPRRLVQVLLFKRSGSSASLLSLRAKTATLRSLRLLAALAALLLIMLMAAALLYFKQATENAVCYAEKRSASSGAFLLMQICHSEIQILVFSKGG